MWLPQDEIGNSPSTPSFLNDAYKGQMIHGEDDPRWGKKGLR
ncbi:MAG: hypothetical protein R2795_21045 [Saprospiraceae bacterium]